MTPAAIFSVSGSKVLIVLAIIAFVVKVDSAAIDNSYDHDIDQRRDNSVSMLRLKKMSMMRLKKDLEETLDDNEDEDEQRMIKRMSMMRLKKPSLMRLRRGPSMMRLKKMTQMRLKKDGQSVDQDCIWVNGICMDEEEVDLHRLLNPASLSKTNAYNYY